MKGWLAIVAVLSILTACILTATYTQSLNTLQHNGRWLSSKLQVGRFVMGAASYMVTRPALQQNRLNLGEWHGYHEILYREALVPRRLAADIHLPPPSHASILFNHSENGCYGVRLSSDERFPPQFFEADRDGAFVRQVPLPAGVCRTGRNHIDLLPDGNHVAVVVNGRDAGRYAAPLVSAGYIGFRGCLQKSSVDNVAIEPLGATRPLFETFDNHQEIVKYIGPPLVLLLLINIVLFFVVKSGPPLVNLNVWLLVTALVLYGLEWFMFGPRYPKQVDLSQYPQYRAAPMLPEIVQEVQQRHTVQKSRPRVLFLGTSQTWGAGAWTESDTWVRRIERGLDNVECINGGISGFNSALVAQAYEKDFLQYQPDAVVINLGFNDNNPDELVANLRKMLGMNKNTLLLLEAASIEYPDRNLLERRQRVKALAEETGTPYMDIHSYLAERHDQGFLWWDFVHLTSFGQKLLADGVLPRVRKLLP